LNIEYVSKHCEKQQVIIMSLFKNLKT